MAVMSPTGLRKLPREQRQAVLAEATAAAEPYYRTDRDLTDFEAFGEEEFAAMSDPALKLDKLAALPANWDSYGSSPIDRGTIAAVRAFLARLPDGASPRVVPTSPGGVQLEWFRGGRVLELEFEGPGVIHYLQVYEDGGMVEDFVGPDDAAAVGLVRWVLQ